MFMSERDGERRRERLNQTHDDNNLEHRNNNKNTDSKIDNSLNVPKGGPFIIIDKTMIRY